MQEFIDRVSSPISGTFFASWMLWNWKIILIVFDSGMNVITKIDHIVNLANLKYGLVLPLISGSIYFIVMPLFLVKIKSFTNHIKILNDLKDAEKQRTFGNLIEFDNKSQNEITLMALKELEILITEVTNNSKALRAIANPISDKTVGLEIIQIIGNLEIAMSRCYENMEQYKDLRKKVSERYFSKYGVNFSTTYQSAIIAYNKIFNKN